MNRAMIGAACLVLAVFSGCATTKAASKPAGPRAAEYYPLAVGNSWSYQVKMLGESRVVDVKIVSEENGFFLDTTGARLTADAFGVRDDKRYLLREPIEVGTTWNNVVSVSSMEQYKIIEAGPGCTVPAGTFNDCVLVESRNRIEGNKTLINELTFAPNVGLVRVATALEIEGRRVPDTLELQKYELKGADVSQGATKSQR